MPFVGLAWCRDTLAEALVAVWRRRSHPQDDHRCQATVLELFMFVCEPGHPRNHYSRTGIPRTHAGWEMQLIIDDGLLYFLYERCCAALHTCSDEGSLRDAVQQLHALLDCDDAEQLRDRVRSHYADTIVEFIAGTQRFEPRGRELLTTWFECLIIHAYLRLAAAAPGSTIGFDLFPAHTGADNVREGLEGLIDLGDLGHRTARKFYCCRAETYTRYYGRNLARVLGGHDVLRFGLVVPYANCVRHLVLTRCWPIDGAENIARHTQLMFATWDAYVCEHGPRSRPPTILVCGYSQGGAAVRLFDDALSGVDVLGHSYFRASAPRWYAPRSRTLARIIAGAWVERDGVKPILHTVTLATMGGIDAHGATGVLAHANHFGGLHLGICHDHDPARFVVPGPLRPRARSRSIVQTLLKFRGPAQVLHGGTWTRSAHRAFADNPAATRLIEEVDRLRVSARFVDEADYFDDRCVGAAFTHLVVGTYGYPGWTVVETFMRALERLETNESERPLLREHSWVHDILPHEYDYATIAGANMSPRRHALPAASSPSL